MKNFKYILGFIALTLCLAAQAQNPVEYKIEGSKIVANIAITEELNVDSILSSFGFEPMNYESLEKSTSKKGWYCTQADRSFIQLQLDKNQKVKDLPPSFDLKDAEIINLNDFSYVPFGVNRFKKTSVRTKQGLTTFKLAGNLSAESVYLSGSFNDWSTLSMPMQKTESGWQLSLKLPAGKHLYKFIIDGRWKHDKSNYVKEDDLNGGYNSVYFVYNYTFRLKGHLDAHQVVLAASFNDWRISQLKMRKNAKGWSLNLYLRPGTHAYKYIVDGDWILDPSNKIIRDDGAGNRNNFMSVGDTLYFRLKGFQSAKEVFCAGNFNGWNWNELRMHKSSRGWIIPYVLAPGNYEYKFKVDGDYIPDPYNLQTRGKGKYRNSMLIVDPNTTFSLKGYSDAKSVRLVGDFVGWDEGYPMIKNGDRWQLELHLTPGKHLYKFIVDGKWIKDPSNKLWEKNEFDSQNSILWVKPLD